MPGRTIERLNVQLTAEDQRLQTGLRRAEARVRRARQRIGRDLQTISNRGALAFGAITAASGAAVVAVGNQAVSIDALSRSIGTTAEEYQILLAAFENTGLDATAVTAVITRLNEVIAEARDGSEPLRLSLDRLGLSFEELQTLSSTEALGLVIDRMNTLTDETERSRIGLELFQNDFERGGVVFTEGSAGLERFAEVLRRDGGIISQRTIDRVSSFSTALGTASRVARAQFLEGFINAAPRFERFTDNITLLAQEARSLGTALGRLVDFLVDYRAAVLGVAAAFGVLTIGRPFVQFGQSLLGGFRELRVALARNTQALERASSNENVRGRDNQGSGIGAGLITGVLAGVGSFLGQRLERPIERLRDTFQRFFVGPTRTIFDTLRNFIRVANDEVTLRRAADTAFNAGVDDVRARGFGRRADAAFNRALAGTYFINDLYQRRSSLSGNPDTFRGRTRIALNVFGQNNAFNTGRNPFTGEARGSLFAQELRDLGLQSRGSAEGLFNAFTEFFGQISEFVSYIVGARPGFLSAVGGLSLFGAAVRIHGENLDRSSISVLRLHNAAQDAAVSLQRFALDLPNAVVRFGVSLNNFFTNLDVGPGRGLVNPRPDDAPRLPRGGPTTRLQRERIIDELFFRIRGREFSEIENQARLPLPGLTANSRDRQIAEEVRRTLNEDIRQAFADGLTREINFGFGTGGSSLSTNDFENILQQGFRNAFTFRRESLPPDPNENVLNPIGRSFEAFLAQQAREYSDSLPDITTPRIIETYGTGDNLRSYWNNLFDAARDIRRRADLEEDAIRLEIDSLFANLFSSVNESVRQQANQRIEDDLELDSLFDNLFDTVGRQRQETELELDRLFRNLFNTASRIGDEEARRQREIDINNLGFIPRAVINTGEQTNFYDNFAQSVGNDLRSAFLRLDLSGSFSDFAQSVLRSIATSFRESLAEQIGAFFGNLFQDIFHRAAGGPSRTGGGFFASILSLPFSGGRASNPRRGAGGIINLGPEFQRPSFQSGGFVPGAFGEEVPIRAHAGELVLNRTQQAALFRAANGSPNEFSNAGNTFNFTAGFLGDTTQNTLDDVRRVAEDIARIQHAEARERGFTNGNI